ncbi:MAG TPA: FAD/NAD(P)-binding protein [Burkholderiaceae bacterium]
MQTIAIVGAGYSGTICAVNLLRLCDATAPQQLKIVLLERHSRHGRGLAYRTWDDNFVLNVPAGNMSALVDDPGHFVRYCQGIDPAFNAGSFVSRRIYGDYLEATLEDAAASSAIGLERVQAEVTAVRRRGDAWAVSCAGGREIGAARVVLALGHFTPQDPAPHAFYGSTGYIGNPWDFATLDRIDDEAPVLLLGAAHTAIDVLFRLTNRSESRKIYLLSRRGLSLQAHRQHPQSPPLLGFPPFFEGLQPTVRNYFRALRQAARERVQQGGDWRDVVNSLRPHTAEIWQRLPLTERRRFLRQAVAYWDIHRHRLAPVAHLRLTQMLKSGQVEVLAGYVQGYAIDAAGVSVTLRERGSGNERQIRVAKVVNCTGPNYDITRMDAPLIAQLRDEGTIRQDDLKLGFEVDGEYRVIDRQGHAASGLFYLGPMLKARYWEAIAVPELRAHARRLAQLLSAG